MTDIQRAPAPAEPSLRLHEVAPADVPADAAAAAERAATRSFAAGASGPLPPHGVGRAHHGLPPGAVGTAALLGIQRAAGNRAASALVAAPRQAGPAPAGSVVQRDSNQQITPSFVIPIEPDSTKKDLGSSASYVKGSIAFKGEVKGEIVPKGKDSAAVSAGGTSNAGGQAEITIAEQKGHAIFDSLNIEKVKETLAFELSKKKLDVSLGAEATIKTRYDWLKGIVGLKFALAGVEWDKIEEAVALGVEISGGLSGEGTVNISSGYDVKLSVKVTAVGEVHPNWPRIAGEVGQRVATEGGKAAVEATTTAAGTEIVVLDMGAVAAAAAAIVVPLAAAVAMGYGAFQGMKNARAAREAAGYGVQMRQKAEECAKGFAMTLTGHTPGSDEGSAEADAQIRAAMMSTRATREMVVAAATQEQGGYQAIYDRNLKRIKDKLYAEGCLKYDEQSKPDWGFIEDLGPEWGMRGVFRSTFRIVLYGGA